MEQAAMLSNSLPTKLQKFTQDFYDYSTLFFLSESWHQPVQHMVEVSRGCRKNFPKFEFILNILDVNLV